MIEEGLMATISGPADGAMGSVDAGRDRADAIDPTARVAWLTVAIAAWIAGGFWLLIWAFVNGLDADPLLSVHAVPFYLGIILVDAVSIALVIRSVRQGNGWRRAFPPGYGVLGAGAFCLIAGLVADVGWREGVGLPQGIAGGLAPTRLLIVAGVALVAVGPLRSALRSPRVIARQWPAVLSACLVLLGIGFPGGFHPASNAWLQRAPTLANAEIWRMDGDGAHQTRLIEARDGAMAWNAVWSPDGTRIAYTRLVLGTRPPEEIPDEADIWVANADGSDAHPLVTRPDWQWLPHWSPDGAWIAYTDEPEGGPWAAAGPAGLAGGIFGSGFGFGSSNPVRTHADIWRVRVDGSEPPERLTDDPGDDRAASYSPDGSRLAFDSTREGRAGSTDVWVIGADGSDPQRLTSVYTSTWGAAWSPDGSRIAFNSWRPEGGGQDIYVVNGTGGGETRLTADPADDIEPSWSHDGRRIVFRRLDGPPDGGRIVSIAADGSDEQELSREPGASFAMTSGGGVWAADRRILFGRAENPPATAHPFVREDLASAFMLLAAITLSFMAALITRVRPPFGAFAALIGIPTAVFALVGEGPRFIPAAVIGGLIVDILFRLASERWKPVVAGAGIAAALVVSAEVTVAATGGLGWSPSLLSGVVVASAAVGAVLGEVVGRPARPVSNP
jgi:Tol biopolymer transport system component